MKYKILFTFIFGLFISTFGQTGATSTQNLIFDGKNREYILYIPHSYDGETAVPLVINLHGYTSNMQDQMAYGDFRKIADTANFIIVHPNGLYDETNQRRWNYFEVNGVDDVGFLSALIDEVSTNFNIDNNRVYSTGMSNGGFMSYLLACQLYDKITAIASVTGSMLKVPVFSCELTHPIPVMEIHGTSDLIVPYNGNVTFLSIPEVVSFWVSKNQCDNNPVVIQIPNNNLIDGSTAEQYVYLNGKNGATVEHYKVIGGGHTWPGSSVLLPKTNHDFDASKVIWRFFQKYKKSDLLHLDQENQLEKEYISIFPNPSKGSISLYPKKPIKELQILTGEGKIVKQLSNISEKIQLSDLEVGIYFVHSRINEEHFVKMIVVH